MRTNEKHSLMLSGIYTHNASCQTIQRAFILIIYFVIFLLIEWTRAAWEFFPSHIKGQFKSCSQWRMFSMNTKSLYGPSESESTQEIGEGAKIVTLRLFKVYMAWIPFFCFFCKCRMETYPVQSFKGKNSLPAVAWNATKMEIWGRFQIQQQRIRN